MNDKFLEESVVRTISATEAEVVRLSDSRTNCCYEPVLFIDLVEPIQLLNHSNCELDCVHFLKDGNITRDVLHLFIFILLQNMT